MQKNAIIQKNFSLEILKHIYSFSKIKKKLTINDLLKNKQTKKPHKTTNLFLP